MLFNTERAINACCSDSNRVNYFNTMITNETISATESCGIASTNVLDSTNSGHSEDTLYQYILQSRLLCWIAGIVLFVCFMLLLIPCFHILEKIFRVILITKNNVLRQYKDYKTWKEYLKYVSNGWENFDKLPGNSQVDAEGLCNAVFFLMSNLSPSITTKGLKTFIKGIDNKSVKIAFTADDKRESRKMAVVRVPYELLELPGLTELLTNPLFGDDGYLIDISKVKTSRMYLLKKRFRWLQANPQVYHNPCGLNIQGKRSNGVNFSLTNSTYSLIDAGAYLCDIPKQKMSIVVQEAVSAGVKKIVIKTKSLQEAKKAKQYCELFPGYLFFLVGATPTDSEWQDSQTEGLEKFLQHPSCVGIGECGLDFLKYTEKAARENQIHVFKILLQQARQFKKPICYVSKAADTICLNLLNKYKADLPPSCLMGYYPENPKCNQIHEFVQKGSYIHIDGSESSDDVKRHMNDYLKTRKIPIDKIVMGSSAPHNLHLHISKKDTSLGACKESEKDAVSESSYKDYWRKCEKHTNEPCSMPGILEIVASCVKCEPQKLAACINENTVSLYNLNDKS